MKKKTHQKKTTTPLLQEPAEELHYFYFYYYYLLHYTLPRLWYRTRKVSAKLKGARELEELVKSFVAQAEAP